MATPVAVIMGLLLGVAQDVPVFPATTSLVQVSVSVNDSAGRPLVGLERSAFRILEDGKAREIVSFARGSLEAGRAPDSDVEVVLLFDTSDSMRPHVARVRDAAIRFLRSVPNVRTRSIVTFDGDVIASRFDEKDPSGVLDDIVARKPGFGSRFFDGILSSANRFELEGSRRAIVVLTDGYDERSKLDLGGAIHAAQDASATVYAISFAHLLGGENQKYAARTLRDVAEATGGQVFAGTPDGMAAQFERIQSDLNAQYVLGFEPQPSTPGRMHRIDVDVKAREKAKVRHRRSYVTLQ